MRKILAMLLVMASFLFYVGCSTDADEDKKYEATFKYLAAATNGSTTVQTQATVVKFEMTLNDNSKATVCIDTDQSGCKTSTYTIEKDDDGDEEITFVYRNGDAIMIYYPSDKVLIMIDYIDKSIGILVTNKDDLAQAQKLIKELVN